MERLYLNGRAWRDTIYWDTVKKAAGREVTETGNQPPEERLLATNEQWYERDSKLLLRIEAGKTGIRSVREDPSLKVRPGSWKPPGVQLPAALPPLCLAKEALSHSGHTRGKYRNSLWTSGSCSHGTRHKGRQDLCVTTGSVHTDLMF